MSLFQFRQSLELLVILTTLIAWWRIPPPRDRVFGVLAAITALAFVVEVAGTACASRLVNNSILYNTFSWMEFIAVLVLIYLHDVRWRASLLLGGIIGTAGVVWCAWMYDPFTFLLTEGILIMALVLALLLLAVLWQMARTSSVPLHRVPEFWLFMGLLVYYGGLTPVVGVIHYVFTDDQALANQLWSIMPLLCILRYLLATFACVLKAREARAHG